MLTVGERLHIARTRADVGVGEMAGHLERHRNRVTAYENAGDDVPLWVVRTYAEVLPNETTVEWLTAEVGDPPRFLERTITTRRYSASDQPELPFPPDVIDLRDCVTGRGAVVTGRAVVTGFGTTLDAA